MTRIDTIFKYIKKSDIVADIGCDAALLSKRLAKKKIYSISSDIKFNIINNAFMSTQEEAKKYISYRVGDGSSSLTEEDNINTFVLSGMGSHTILNIISSSKILPDNIITISNNDYKILRSGMQFLGYKIKEEVIIKENKKFYNLIFFIKGLDNLSQKELLIGVNHQNLTLLNEYLNERVVKLNKIINMIPDNNITDKNNLIIERDILQNELF
ncbi:MAG: tRNA (adenine(22)-N(1))-methyltransferase TrmK [Bacilli bacterium]